MPKYNPKAEWDANKSVPNQLQNPAVEACACEFGSGNFSIGEWTGPNNCGTGTYKNCFERAIIDQTCFDEDTHKLYIRTRLENLGGRKWLDILP